MGYRLGIELGRSRTTAVIVSDGEGPRPVALAEDTTDIATALFVERRGAVCAGPRAEALAAEEPGRLLHGFLDRIGSAEPLRIGNGPATSSHHAQDVAAALVAWVVARVAELEGEPARAIAVSMPTDLAERSTIEPLKRALAAQGMAEVRVLGEYVAAGRFYTHAVHPTPGEPFVALVLGTSGVRAAVLHGDDEGRVFPLGRPATRSGIGADAYDEAVLRHAMTATEILGDIEGEPIDADAWRSACRAAREDLCATEVAEFTISVGDYDVPVVLDREQFEADIEGVVAAAADLLEEAVGQAGIAVGDVAAVLLCGAAAATPALGRELAARLRSDARLIREPNPVLTVAAGAALALGAPVAPADRQTKRAKSEPAPTNSQRPAVAAPVAAPAPVPAAAPEQAVPRPVRPAAPAPVAAPDAPLPVGRVPAQQPGVGSGRPIRPHEPKGAPRRDHARLLGFDNGAAPARSGTAVLAVIPGRELGTVDDLLQVPAPQHTDPVRRASNPAEEAWVDVPAEYSEIEDHIVDERTLGQRARSMATPARVLTLGVLTVVVVVGTGAWIPIH